MLDFTQIDKVEPKITVFPTTSDGLCLIKGLEVRSMCVPHYQYVNAVAGKKRAREVRKGDELWTLDKGIPVKTKVTSIQERNATDVFKIYFSNGKSICLTGEHPLKTKYGWVEAGSSLGESIEYVNPKTYHKKQHELNIGYSLGYSLAVIMADGAIENLRTICVKKKKVAVMKKFSLMMKATFGVEEELTEVDTLSGFTGERVHQWQYRLTSSQITKRVIKMLKLPESYKGGHKTFIFRLPDIVKYNDEVLRGFIEGYLDTDGYTYTGEKPYKRIFSSNKVFMDELAELLQNTYHANNGNNSIAPSYAMSIPKDHISWLSKHGFYKEEFSIDLGESTFIEVTAIEKMPDAKVYSFECSEEFPTFCVSGFLTHNCAHHLAPFFGTCTIGYIPNKQEMAGLSKFQRVLDYICMNPTEQETLTKKILDYLVENIRPKAIFVYMECKHTCMIVRGVQNSGSTTETVESYNWSGNYSEVLNIARNNK